MEDNNLKQIVESNAKAIAALGNTVAEQGQQLSITMQSLDRLAGFQQQLIQAMIQDREELRQHREETRQEIRELKAAVEHLEAIADQLLKRNEDR